MDTSKKLIKVRKREKVNYERAIALKNRGIRIPKTTMWRIKNRGWGYIKYYEEEKQVEQKIDWKVVMQLTKKFAKMVSKNSMIVDDLQQETMLRLLEQNILLPTNNDDLEKYIHIVTKYVYYRFYNNIMKKNKFIEYNDNFYFNRNNINEINTETSFFNE